MCDLLAACMVQPQGSYSTMHHTELPPLVMQLALPRRAPPAPPILACLTAHAAASCPILLCGCQGSSASVPHTHLVATVQAPARAGASVHV
jgi:hypothetical protein